MDYPARRRQQLLESIRADGPDALLISNPVNVTYLTGFSGDSSCLILTRERALLVSDFRYTQQIAAECPGVEADIRPSGKPITTAVAEALQKLGVGSVGFEANHLTVANYETLREQAKTINWKAEKDQVEELRAVKDPSEVSAIREAIDVAERPSPCFAPCCVRMTMRKTCATPWKATSAGRVAGARVSRASSRSALAPRCHTRRPHPPRSPRPTCCS